MNTPDKRHGTLIYFSGPKSFGFISSRSDDGTIQKFFLHMTRVERCEPLSPYIGCVCKFNVDMTRPPTIPREFWRACDIEIFNPFESAGSAQ